MSTVSAAIDFHCLRLVTVLPLFLMFNSGLINFFFFFFHNICLYLCLRTLPNLIYSSVYTRFIDWLYYSVKKRLLTILTGIIRVVYRNVACSYVITFTPFQYVFLKQYSIKGISCKGIYLFYYVHWHSILLNHTVFLKLWAQCKFMRFLIYSRSIDRRVYSWYFTW